MKKVFRKVAAILTACCMLPAIPANAASSFEWTADSWDISYTDLGTDYADSFIAYSNEVGIDDTASMIISGSYKWASGITTKMTLNSSSFSMPAGTYTLSFSAKTYDSSKGGSGTGNLHMYVGGLHAIGSTGTGDNMNSKTEGEDGWATYTKTLTLTSDKTSTFLNMQFLSVPNTYIDNVSLKDESGKEYIVNGDFADATQKEVNLVESIVEPAEWYTSHVSMDDYPDSYMKINRTVGYESDSSMHVYATYVGSTVSYKTYMRLYTYSFMADTAKTHTLTLYTKGTTGISSMHVYFMPSSGGSTKVTQLNEMNTETLANGWVKRTCEFTPTASMGKFMFQAYSTSDFYIDDISFAANDTPTVNLIANGGFEEYEEGAIAAKNTDTVSNNWSVIAAGTGASNLSSNAVSELSTEHAHSGKASWVIAYPEKQTDTYYGMINSSLNVPAGSYTFTMHTRGIYDTAAVMLILSGSSGWVKNGYLAQDAGTNFTITGIEESNGWKKYTMAMELSSAVNSLSIRAAAQRGTVDWLYIDDISLVDANGTEYMKDGGFENYRVLNTTDLERIMAYPAANGTHGTITWVNPINDNISSIKMYVNGSEYTITADTASEAFNEVVLTGLTEGTSYDIKLELTIGDKVTEYETTLIPDSTVYTLGAWTAKRIDGVDRNAENPYYANTIAELDKTVSCEGDASIKIVSNRDGYRDHTTFRLTQSVTLDTNEPYYFSFKAKAENCKSLYLRVDGSSIGDIHTPTSKSSADADGWVTYEYVIEETDDTYLGTAKNVTYQIMLADWCDVVYVDDVQLKLYSNDDEEPIGNNLLADGGFEFASSTASAPEIQYWLEIDGEGQWVTVEAVEETGKYRAIADVKNISGPEPFEVSLFLAVYQNDTLIDVAPTIGADIPESTWTATTVSSDIDVEDVTGCTLKAMLWDGYSPLTEATEIPIPAAN
ncbi:MAG: hypothetical protein J6C82_02240 [Clostridia bacterium]|nr:hypothetical protein [Clostridia bacterium]